MVVLGLLAARGAPLFFLCKSLGAAPHNPDKAFLGTVDRSAAPALKSCREPFSHS